MPMNSQHRPGGLTHFGRYLYALWLRAFLEGSGYDIVEIWPSSARSGQTTDPGLQNSHPGTLNGGPTVEADPVVDDDGFAYDVDGVDDYSKVPDDPAFTVGADEDLTVIHWVGLSQSFFDNDDKYICGQENNARIIISFRGTQNYVKVFFNDGTDGDNTSDGTLSAGANMLAMRVDRSTDTLTAYANKVSGGVTGNISAVGEVDVNGDLYWGQRPDGSNHLPGKMGVRAIVKSAISDSDLDKIYDVGIDRANR